VFEGVLLKTGTRMPKTTWCQGDFRARLRWISTRPAVLPPTAQVHELHPGRACRTFGL